MLRCHQVEYLAARKLSAFYAQSSESGQSGTGPIADPASAFTNRLFFNKWA